jgi:hypothetical protein
MVLLIGRNVGASVISTSDSRLPMSLSTVISDLEAEDCNELTTACLLLSHSVTGRERKNLLGELLGTTGVSNSDADSAEEDLSSWKAIGTDKGLALAQPSGTQEVASTVEACGGTILYYPSATDLARGEGLFDSLAPAMEKILSTDGKKGCLLVIVEGDGNDSTTQSKLEKAAEAVLSTLITDKPVSSLTDVFESVLYVSPPKAVEVLTSQLQQSTTPADAAASIATAVSSDLSLLFPITSSDTSLSAVDLAAARKLGPAARQQHAQVMELVQDACQNPDGTPKLVPEFGSLCDAAVQRALNELDEKSAGSASLLIQSGLGKQIRSRLMSELFSELGDLLQEQLYQLQLASFEDCKKSMAQLRVTPNLANDMEEATKKSRAAFSKAANKLVATKATLWSVTPAKQQYAAKLKAFLSSRLLAAQASGQYKPIPRKGVTLGFHWLMPKPFGNDYRQEPWMVHATDNLVYIPKNKISDVSPEEVAAGDWRSKIVPSPAGNDMLYLQ